MYFNALKEIDKIVSISDYTKKQFNNIYNHNIIVLPLGVDIKRFRRIEIFKREKSFIFVGHIKPRKGLIYTLQAFNNIMHKYKDVKLYIIGEKSKGKYAEECFKYIRTINTNNQIVILGKVSNDDLVEMYNKSMANVLNSININQHFEGFGLIHLEANACGIPSIGSYNCGNETAIIDGLNGYLTNQKDIKDIEAKMELIIQNFNKNFQYFQTQCLEYAKSNSWDKYFESLLKDVYR